MTISILSIQSWVAYGHVGNASAMFPLQRLGAEVWAVNTVQFSNHTGYGSWRGQVFGAEAVREVLQGIEERGVLSRCDAVLSGYMGDAAIGAAILDAVERVKGGESGGAVLLRSGDRRCRPRHFRSPRHSGIPARCCPAGGRHRHPQPFRTGLADGAGGAQPRRRQGRRRRAATTGATLRLRHLAGCCGDAGGLHRCPRRRGRGLLARAHAAAADRGERGGRCHCRVVLFHRLRWGEARIVAASAVSSVYGLLQRTAEAGSREILLIEAQEEFVTPSRMFHAEPV